MSKARAPRSLARDLLVLLVALVAVIWLATAVVSFVDARHELDELLDAHLAQAASLLMVQAEAASGIVDAEHAPQLHRYNRRVAFQLWDAGGKLRLHSSNAPDVRLSPVDDGFSDVVMNARQWRVFSTWNPEHRYLVQVGERVDARNEIVGKIAKNLLVPLVIALPALAVLIWLGIRRAMQPLRVLNRQVEERAPDNLAPIELRKTPAEVAPLVGSLNRLFERVLASIENERRFTADAAHELRTPLAALRAQAQVARGATNDAERRRALDNVIAGCDRASHLVQQLLTLARLEPEGFQAHREPCNLRSVVQQTIAELAPAAVAKNIDIELEDGPAVTVAGDARLLSVLFRNLIDNAVRYSPPSTTIRLRVANAGDGAIVSVVDQGPGVPAEQLGQLGRRFHRLLGTEAAGTGLGLSIVKRVAELHHAEIVFEQAAPGGGLDVTVRFPGRTPTSRVGDDTRPERVTGSHD